MLLDDRQQLKRRAAGLFCPGFPLFDRGLGLVGPMRATTPSDTFLATIAPVLASAGPLPHVRLDTGGETTAPRKQAARMLKCECQACGYTVRTARKWLETAGAPVCPIAGHGPMQHGPLDKGGDDEPGAKRLSGSPIKQMDD